MTRDEFKKDVVHILKQFHDESKKKLSPKMEKGYEDWAEAITVGYYDECPNEFSPNNAVSEELSYL